MNKHGKITPSKFADVLVKGRAPKGQPPKKWGDKAQTYALEVAMERIGVERPEVFAYALSWGNDHEEDAAQMYMEVTGRFIAPTDPILHPELDFVGGTPDGLIGEDSIIEIKCPYNPANHLMNLTENGQLAQYMAQIQGYLWITGRQFCDFVSYDPRFPRELRLHVHTVVRDQAYIDNLAARVSDFEMELVRPIVEQLKKLQT